MRVTIVSPDPAMTFMRRAGYGYQRGEAASGFAGKEGSGETAFVRRVSAGDFPRYHAYVTEAASRQPQAASNQITINLHVDQKAPTYERGRAHSGEYDGLLVTGEAARLRQLAEASTEERRNQGTEEPLEKRKGFFGRLFG